MKYLREDLTAEEIKYVCEKIPLAFAMDYFRKNSKNYSQLIRGFRVNSLTEEKKTQILFDFRKKDFIEYFIAKVIKVWLDEIDEALEKTSKEGEKTPEEVYIEVLSQSYFEANVPLFFKLKEEDKSEEYLRILSAAVEVESRNVRKNYDEKSSIKKKQKEDDKTKEELNEKISEEIKKSEHYRKSITELKTELAEKKAVIESENKIKKDLCNEIDILKRKITELEENINKKEKEYIEKTSSIISQSEDYENQIEELNRTLEETEKIINEYKEKITNSKDGSEALKAENKDLESKTCILRLQNGELEEKIKILTEEKISFQNCVQKLQDDNSELSSCNVNLRNLIMELEKKTSEINQVGLLVDSLNLEEREATISPVKPLCPEDFDEFEDYFRYNLNSIGFTGSEEGEAELLDYFIQTIFCGIPILIKRGPGINLANCLSNTIYGQKEAKRILYKKEIEIAQVEEILESASDRVICLDGFVGNCNEIELLSVLNCYRNKIIILTYMYDKTLKYIPMEILSYVHFINLDRIYSLMNIKDITEDPSEIKEQEIAYFESCSDLRSRRIFMEIAQECGVDVGTASTLSDQIKDELSMNRMLLFTLLPYVSVIMGVNPYNCSKRLQKYAGETGKSPYKEKLMRWFG